ncbi:MAG: hypothetical protein ACK5MR_17745 [Cumulibacter sp.]
MNIQEKFNQALEETYLKKAAYADEFSTNTSVSEQERSLGYNLPPSEYYPQRTARY